MNLKPDLSDAPWWVRTIWILGPTTIIAVGLVWFLAASVTTQLRAAQDTLVVTTQSLTSLSQNLMLHHEQAQQLQRNIEYYMKLQATLTQQLCVNAARTPEARDACFRTPQQ